MPAYSSGASVHDVEHLRLGIVVSHDLLGEHLHVEIGEVHRVGKQPEQLVDRLLIGELLLHRRLVQLLRAGTRGPGRATAARVLGGVLNLTPSAFSICGTSAATLSAYGPSPASRSRAAGAARSGWSARAARPVSHQVVHRVASGSHSTVDAGHQPDDARDVVAANDDAFFHELAREVRLERRELVGATERLGSACGSVAAPSAATGAGVPTNKASSSAPNRSSAPTPFGAVASARRFAARFSSMRRSRLLEQLRCAARSAPRCAASIS